MQQTTAMPESKAATIRQAEADLSKAMKDVEIDEPADRFIHRPCAQLLVRGLLTLPRGLVPTPNFITLMSLLVGWVAAAFMYDGLSHGTSTSAGTASASNFGYGQETSLRVAGVLMFLSLVFDCMDGQLARATGQTSPVGRFLDGIADMLVIASYSTVVIVCGARAHGMAWWALGAVSCISLQQHVLFYDKIKITFDLRFQAKSAADVKKRIADYGLDMNVLRAQQAAAKGIVENVAMFFAVRVQASLNLESVSEEAMLRQESGKCTVTAQNKGDALAVMRMVSFLGTGTHLFLWYLSTFTGADNALMPYAFLAFNILVGNAFWLYTWKRSKDAGLTDDPPFEPNTAMPFVVWGLVLLKFVI